MGALIPFAEWLGITRSARNRHRVVVVIDALEAYFDESSPDGRGPLTVISGFIAAAQTWLDFDAFWRAAIKSELKDLGPIWFHMVECENGVGQFSRWHAQPELRHFAARTMADAIVKAGAKGFWASIDARDWEAIDDVQFKARYPKPYHFCFEECVRQVSEWVAEFAPGEDVDLIFAEQREYQASAHDIFDAYRRSKADHHLNTLRFGPMQKSGPLQAADLAVYCANKDMERALFGRDTQERIYRTALDVLYANPASFTGQHYDGLGLMKAAEDYRQSSGMRSQCGT